ncbi:dihydroneopterin aldolase [Pedobacter sp. SL55]|uniref:dihydroneopterin aldolase n=1 Tax=Pedobacter sp. SL55 TaxID=2995161 RepID=UPI00226F584D|nr:dihydroneopterin aldolase [Pedobacter sp. SL55]WAC40001.1 dihydroneopterin aldolase [Pedobacter sp. SL55]
MYTQTVALKDVRCHALHGFYPEEQLIGCIFMVDAEVTFTTDNNDSENLDKTVNYEVLNNIITIEMANTQKLLETVVKNILEKIKTKYPFIETVKVGIRKMNPPMPGQIGQSFVQLTYTRS